MKFVLGVDEAGRGPLAGPVAVGVIAAPIDFDFHRAFPGLNDSKKLSEKKREALFETLVEHTRSGTLSVAVILKTAHEIDGRGIAVVIRNAVREGIQKVLKEPTEGKVWLDGALSAPDIYIQETVIGGDGRIPAIMLASIAAKVSRDRHMVRLSKKYPLYDFHHHKGYGTASHRECIRVHGLSDLHRRSFCRNLV